MYYFKTLTCLVVACGVQASAATIDAFAKRGSFGPTETIDTNSGQTSVSVSEEFMAGTAIDNIRVVGDGFASADAESGVLRARIEKLEDINQFGDSFTAYASMQESLTLTGNGTVTFNLAYSGIWDIDPNPNFDVITSLRLLDDQFSGDNDSISINNRADPLSGTTFGDLSVSATVSGTKTLNLATSLFTSFGRGTGILDFSNSAYLSFETTGDVAVSFADPNFLSGVTGGTTDPVVSTVPLPASMPLMLVGLAGFAGIARRKKRAA